MLAGGVCVCYCGVGDACDIGLLAYVHLYVCVCVCVCCFESKTLYTKLVFFAVLFVLMIYEYCVFLQQNHEGLWINAEALKKIACKVHIVYECVHECASV